MKIIEEVMAGLRFIVENIDSDATLGAEDDKIYCYFDVTKKWRLSPPSLCDAYIAELKKLGWNKCPNVNCRFYINL